MAKKIEWNQHQKDIFENVESGDGHTVVEALAGTGKSTTVEEAIDFVPPGESILMMAFNKDIVTAFTKRGTRANVMTTHSFGLKAIGRSMRRPEIDKNKSYVLLDAFFSPKGPDERELGRSVVKLASLAKGCLVDDGEGLEDLADDFGIECFDRPRLIDLTSRLLAASKDNVATIDFDDMIWFPHVQELTIPKFDRIFVDETQDLSKAQVELCLKAIAYAGRICVVGDRHQAIYQFRGADSDSIPKIVDRLKARVLPLSVTYRCSLAVVAEANKIVPELRAAPGAKEGKVHRDVTEQRMLAEARPGDFVLSRTNAPLLGACMKLLKEGRRATILGRDVGASLAGLVRKMGAFDVPSLSRAVDEWRGAEIARLSAKKYPSESAMSAIMDRAECIHAISEGARAVDEVLRRIERLFQVDEGEPSNGYVTFSTTHKAKGLERDRVWVLADTYRRYPSQEEDNLYYVAVTRAKDELFLVRTAQVDGDLGVFHGRNWADQEELEKA